MKKLIIFTFLILLSGCTNEKDAYYRGVYDACVRQSVVNNKVTSYDILTCSFLVDRARREDWYNKQPAY